MDILAGITAAKTAAELLKALREKLGSPNVNIEEVQARLVELTQLILDGRQAIMDAQEEIRQLKKERDGALEQLKLADDMEYQIDGGFYLRTSEAQKGVIPYCATCWTTERKLTHMIGDDSSDYYTCPLHKIPLSTKEKTERRNNRSRMRSAQPTRPSWWL